MNRRGILAALAGAPAMAKAGIATAGEIGAATPPVGYYPGGSPTGGMVDRPSLVRRLLGNKEAMEIIRKRVEDGNRRVGYLDPDLAANRSMSLAAKAIIQRRRNIEADMARELTDEWPWQKLERLGFGGL